ncbi:MAG: hypothetical protein M1549_00830 [Candidatus Dependentiae bacterium]|nr:hypothetical protein [Candidatus Dependentiae bacterium]
MKKVVLCLVMLTLAPQTWAMKENEKIEKKGKSSLSKKEIYIAEQVFTYTALLSLDKFEKLEKKGNEALILKTTKYANKAHEPFEADVTTTSYDLSVNMKNNMRRSLKYGIFMALLAKSGKIMVSCFPTPETEKLFLTPTNALVKKFDEWDDAALIEKAGEYAEKSHAPFQPIVNAARQSQPSESTLKNMRRSLKYGVIAALLRKFKPKLFDIHLDGCYGIIAANNLRGYMQNKKLYEDEKLC